MRRRRFSELEVLETLIRQNTNIRCFRCKGEFEFVDLRKGIQREHLAELALGGKDEPINCAYSHKLCHDLVTNGTKTTTAGSSKQRIAKVKRLQKKRIVLFEGEELEVRPHRFSKPKRSWPSRPMQSRKFPKRR